MYKRIICIVALILLVTAGCAKEQIFTSSPPIRSVSTSAFEVKIEPLRAEGYNYYNRFRFEFTNKSSNDLVLVWSKSYYLQNKKRYGIFGWEGLTFEQYKGLQEEPNIPIAPGQKYTLVIYPLKLIGWEEEGVRLKATPTKPEEGFTIGVIPPGENGISLAVLENGKLVRKNLLVQIRQD